MTLKACKLFFKLLIALALFLGVQQLTELSTGGFYLQKIQADDIPYQARFEAPPLTMEEEELLQQLLSQSYSFIGAGSECFAFVSEDGTAVIKFFKLDHIRPVYFRMGLLSEDHSACTGTLSQHPLTKLSLPGFLNTGLKRVLGMREFRIERTLSSIKLSHDALKKETGILYLHLNPTTHLHRTLTLYDSCSITHTIDLDTTKFFLQKRATPLEKHFAALKNNQDPLSAQKSIDSLLELILNRCKKGFSDRDLCNKNLGFVGTQAIEIDSGSFRKNPQMQEPWIYKQELFYGTLELKLFLKKNYEEMISYLDKRVEEEIH